MTQVIDARFDEPFLRGSLLNPRPVRESLRRQLLVVKSPLLAGDEIYSRILARVFRRVLPEQVEELRREFQRTMDEFKGDWQPTIFVFFHEAGFVKSVIGTGRFDSEVKKTVGSWPAHEVADCRAQTIRAYEDFLVAALVERRAIEFAEKGRG